MKQVFEMAVAFLPPALLIGAWCLTRNSDEARSLISVLCGVLLIILLLLGAVLWQEDHECTRLASSLIFSASLWFTGPFVVYAAGRSWGFPAIVIGATVMFFLGLAVCFGLLVLCKQIWGW